MSGGHVESCVFFFFFFCLAELSASIVLAGATVNSHHSTASFNKFFQAVFLEFFSMMINDYSAFVKRILYMNILPCALHNFAGDFG